MRRVFIKSDDGGCIADGIAVGLHRSRYHIWVACSARAPHFLDLSEKEETCDALILSSVGIAEQAGSRSAI